MPFDCVVKFYRDDGLELDTLRESSLKLSLEEALPSLKSQAQHLLDIEAITEKPDRFLIIDVKTGNVVESGVRIMSEECPVCGGWGQMSNEDPPPDEETCDYCQGSGAIPGSKAYEDHVYR